MIQKNTRNAQGGGTIRHRSDGRWEARYTVGIDPGTGKQIQKSVYGQTQKDVRQRLTKLTTELDEGSYFEPSNMTIAAWLDIWTKEYLGDVKPRTKDSYMNTVKNHIKPALGRVKLSTLTTVQIQAFYNGLSKGTEDAPGLSGKTVHNVHGVLHRALSDAVTISYLKYNVADHCKLPRKEKTTITPLDANEITAFLQAARGNLFEYVYRVTLFTGLRQGEVLGLTWSCVDFKRGTLLIDKQLQKSRDGSGKYGLVSPKNDKARTLTPATSVMNLLSEIQRRQQGQKAEANCLWQESDLVFTNEFGRNLSAQTVYLYFKKIAAAIGRPDARFHDLRHSYAVASLMAGDDIKTIQENLGHHTASFTLDTYAHVTVGMKKASADRMEQFIHSVSAP